MFKKFPREVGPPRKVVSNMKDMLRFINLYNGRKKAVYTSIYSFENIAETWKVDYETAIIDKLFFDFDDKSCDSYKECSSLHNHLTKENIKHSIVMSGRGYHLYVHTEPYSVVNKKSCIYNGQMYFISKLSLICDPQVLGNPAQMARVPNTYNIKGSRFCIPLTNNQFCIGDEGIKELAKEQNFVKDIFIGEKLFDLKPLDYKSEKEIDTSIFETDNDAGCEIDYFNHAPNCIKQMLKNGNAGWKERFLIILYYRDMGYSRKEVFNILQENLDENKFKHCVHEEKQLQYLFSRHDLTFPCCDKIIQDGFCTGKCKNYNKVIYK